MKKILFSFIFLLAVASFVNGQSIVWEHTVTQVFGFNPIRNFEGNLLVRGLSTTSSGYAAYTANYDLDGNVTWQAPGRAVGLGPPVIVKNTDGTYIIGDQVRGYSTFNDLDVFLQQLDANGDTSSTWKRTYVIPNSIDQPTSIHLLPGGDLLISGQSVPYPLPTAYSLRRTDNQGNTIWYKNFGKDSQAHGGSVLVNKRGNFTMAGRVARLTNYPLTRHMFFIEVSPNGDSIMGKSVVPFDSSRSVNILLPTTGFIETTNGDYLFSGVVEDANGQNERSFVARVDSAFNLIWTYEHPLPTTSTNVFAAKVQELEDGSILFLAANSPVQSTGFFLVHLTSAGQFISQTELQSQACPNSAVLPYDWAFLPDSSIVICGQCQSNSQGYIGRWKDLGLPTVATPVGIAEEERTYKANLGQSYPNPNTGSATIPYILPTAASRASIELRELVTGRLVGTYQLPVKGGEAQIDVNLDRIISGNYVYSLIVDGAGIATGKMVVIK